MAREALLFGRVAYLRYSILDEDVAENAGRLRGEDDWLLIELGACDRDFIYSGFGLSYIHLRPRTANVEYC